MKNSRTAIFGMVTFLSFAFFLTSCDKSTSGFSEDNLSGEFIGTHFLNIPTDILNALNSQIPDTVDLTAGFVDTITITNDDPSDKKISIYSALLDVTVEGTVTGDNRFRIPRKAFDELDLGGVIVKGAAVSSNGEISIPSKSIGTSSTITLNLGVRSVGTFSLPSALTIPTQGTFTRTAN